MRLHRSLLIASVLLIFFSGVDLANGDGIERPTVICEIRLPGGVPERSLITQLIEAAQRAGYSPEGPVEWSEGYFELFREASKSEHHRVGIWLVWKFDDRSTLRVYSFYEKLHFYKGTGWKQVSTDMKTRLVETSGLYGAIRSKCGL